MLNTPLYLAQRLSALIMLPLVIGHIAVMIYAIQGGLTAAEILGRTQGSLWWTLFYGLFVVAVSVHTAIGLRTIAFEWWGLKGLVLNAGSTLVAMLLLVTGWRAVYAVTVVLGSAS